MTRERRWSPWKLGVVLLLTVALGAWYAGVRRKSAVPETGPEAGSSPVSDDSTAPGLQGTILEERPQVGYLAPDFALPDLEGRTVVLSNFRGKKAVFLNFWATWCPPCRAEMPTMEEAYQEYKGKGLEILAVSIDTGSKETVQAFMEELNLTFPALLDPDMAVIQMYRIAGIPGTVLIDRQGVIRAVEIGYRDWTSPESRTKLEQLLE